MKTKLARISRSLVAIACIFATMNALASTSSLATEVISQSTTLANGQFNGAHPSAEQFTTLATTLNSYIAAADKDGTITAAETFILTHTKSLATPNLPVAVASYKGLHSQGWLGSQNDIESFLARLTDDGRADLIARVKSQGLKSVMQAGVTALNSVATLIVMNQTNKHPHLIYASYGVQYLQIDSACTVMTGSFLAIGAIGGVAMLGVATAPLGGLLVAISGVGLFACFLAC